jgi:5'-nucleotidase
MEYTMRNFFRITAALGVGLVGGCQAQQPKPSAALAAGSVMDVKPVKTVRPTYSNPQFVTPPEEPTAAPVVTPVYASTPDPTPAPRPHKSAHSDLAVAGKYKVKKGDTLYRIAKTQYGDGKKWIQIASANPGVTPQSLKVGQMIVVP